MKSKLLTKRQQVGIFNTADPVAVLREYVSFSKDVLFVAQKRMHSSSFEEFVRNNKDVTEIQKQMFQNLTEDDAYEIYFNIEGHIYPEVLEKMLDTFPKEVSKELLFEYGKYCQLPNSVLVRAIGLYGSEAKEILFIRRPDSTSFRMKYLSINLFNKIFRVFGKEDTKQFLMTQASDDLDLGSEVEAKILRIYSGEDLKELLKVFIANSVRIGGELFSKIFEVCASKEEIEELLNQALKNDMDIWYETLDKIVEYFPPAEAKKFLDTFFEETSPGCCEYKDEDKKEYYNRLILRRTKR